MITYFERPLHWSVDELNRGNFPAISDYDLDKRRNRKERADHTLYRQASIIARAIQEHAAVEFDERDFGSTRRGRTMSDGDFRRLMGGPLADIGCFCLGKTKTHPELGQLCIFYPIAWSSQPIEWGKSNGERS